MMQNCKQTLNGNWTYLTDEPGNMNYTDSLIRFSNRANSSEMSIPCNWENGGLKNYSGVVWFKKDFDLENQADYYPFFDLQFSGIDYFAEVWLNGVHLGKHEGYFQKFGFDVTAVVKKLGNELIVRVNSPNDEPGTVWPNHKTLIKGIFGHHDCRPGAWSLEHGQDGNTGGIWNDVSIIYRKEISYDNVKVTTKLNSNYSIANLQIELEINSELNECVDEEITLRILSPEAEALDFVFASSLKKGKNFKFFELELKNPLLWLPHDIGVPNVYELHVSSINSVSSSTLFGIRDVKLDETGAFFINGNRLFLRGTNIIPEQYLSLLSHSKIARQVALMKEANINIVRVHAHITREEFYEQCDKAGLLIWQDFALQWTYDESSRFLKNAVSQIKDMVRTLFNHPSIAFWCCHNEPGGQIVTLDPALESAVLSLDTSRIVRRASNYEEHAYDGWYWGKKEHYAATPMGPLVTEYGAQGMPEKLTLKKFMSDDEIETPDWAKWAYHNFQYEQTFNVCEIELGENIDEFINNSQKYQCEVLKTATDFYRNKKNDGITAVFQFMFIDCWPSITWSVIDYDFNPKPAYFTLKESFQPLYPSVFVRQYRYLQGANLQIDVRLINDTMRSYPELLLNLYIEDKKIGTIRFDDVQHDSVKFINYEKIMISLPKEISLGVHNVKCILTEINSAPILSSNSFEINIVSKYTIFTESSK